MKDFLGLKLAPKVNAKALENIVRARLKQRADESAYLQNRKRMTQYERGRGAVEQMTQQIIDWHASQGRVITWDHAHKLAEAIANKAEK